MDDVQKFEERSEAQETIHLPQVAQSSVSLVQMAMQKNYDPEFIKQMMDLQERNDARVAKQAYHKAMAKFKANPPEIWRDMQVKYEQGTKTTEWSHADLATAGKAIDIALGKHGLNSTWRLLPIENNKTRVTCIIAHELGHSEETFLEAGPDKTGSKNDIQAIGSTVFYLERYTLFALTGLAPARMDDDGNAASGPVEYIDKKQVSTILDLINSKEADEGKFCEYMGVEKVEEIQSKDFNSAVIALKKKKKPERQPGEE